MKKAVKILLWIVGVVVAIVIIASILVSPIAKNYINKHGEDLIGRVVHVDGLQLNIYTGHAAIHGLKVYEEDKKGVFVGFDTLDVKAHLLKLLGNKAYVKHILLSGLNVNVEQYGERFNFSSILDNFSSDSTATEKDTSPSNWTIEIHNINLNHARLKYMDIANSKHWNIADINFNMPGFVLGGNDNSKAGLNLAFSKGGRLAIVGDYNAATNHYLVNLKISDFSMANIKEYVDDYLDESQLGGTINLDVTAQGSLDEVMSSNIKGNVALSSLELKDKNNDVVVGFESFNVGINNVNLAQNVINIDSVCLHKPCGHYQQWKEHSNISQLLLSKPTDTIVEETAADSTESNSESKPLQLTVSNFIIDNGTLVYDDHTLPEVFHFPITNFGITANDINFSGQNAAKVRATLPGGGHLLVNWKGDIEDWKKYQSLFITIKGLDMRKLSPWAVAYTGQPIEDGVFSLTSHNNIRNSNIEGKNNLDIYKAQVGGRKKDVDAEYKLPLKAALYVLKDKNDKILIDVPIKGNIDSPEFNYMKIVWKTLGNLVVKVATSPARAIGDALGMSGEDLEFMPINADQRAFTSEQYHFLGDIATISKSDSLIFFTFEQQMPLAENDSIARIYEIRNEMLRRYLIEQGVSESRIIVQTGEPIDDKSRTGYKVISEMKID